MYAGGLNAPQSRVTNYHNYYWSFLTGMVEACEARKPSGKDQREAEARPNSRTMLMGHGLIYIIVAADLPWEGVSKVQPRLAAVCIEKADVGRDGLFVSGEG